MPGPPHGPHLIQGSMSGCRLGAGCLGLAQLGREGRSCSSPASERQQRVSRGNPETSLACVRTVSAIRWNVLLPGLKVLILATRGLNIERHTWWPQALGPWLRENVPGCLGPGRRESLLQNQHPKGPSPRADQHAPLVPGQGRASILHGPKLAVGPGRSTWKQPEGETPP